MTDSTGADDHVPSTGAELDDDAYCTALRNAWLEVAFRHGVHHLTPRDSTLLALRERGTTADDMRIAAITAFEKPWVSTDRRLAIALGIVRQIGGK